MTSRYDIATIKKQLAAAEQHDKEIYGEKYGNCYWRRPILIA